MSENEYDWLGHGAYFWENSFERALQWAKLINRNPQHSKHKIKDPFVVGAILDLGNCLDLTDAESLEMVRTGYVEYCETVDVLGFEMPVNKPGFKGDEDLLKRHLDCAVINYLHSIRADEGKSPFSSVRGVFTEGGELYPGAKIQSKTHTQIAVRSPEKSVLAYFRPFDAQ